VYFGYYLVLIFKMERAAILHYLPLALYYSTETACFVLATYIYSRLWSGYQDFEFEAALQAVEDAVSAENFQNSLSPAEKSGLARWLPMLSTPAPAPPARNLRRASSGVTMLGFGRIGRLIEGVTDRIESRQATAARVPITLPCFGKDEYPIWTLALMVVAFLLIWASMLSTILMHTDAFSELNIESHFGTDHSGSLKV
jgi:hypothetical protein